MIKCDHHRIFDCDWLYTSTYNEDHTALQIMRVFAGSNENVHENLVYCPRAREGDDDLLIYMTRSSNVPFVQTEFR